MISAILAFLVALFSVNFSVAQTGPLAGYGASLFAIQPIASAQSLGVVSSTASAQSNVVLVTQHAIPQGALAVACLFAGNFNSNAVGTIVVSSVNDGVNTYSVVTSDTFKNTPTMQVFLYAAPNASAVATGAQLTASYNATNGNYAALAGAEVQGTLPTGSIHRAIASSININPFASVLLSPQSITFGCGGIYAGDGASSAYGGASGFTNLATSTFGNGAVALDYNNTAVVVGTGITYNPIWSGSANFVAGLAAGVFKGN